MLSIQNRLKKGFRFTTVLTALAGVIAIIVMGIMSTQYSDALKYYGFSQGDIGKSMVAFTETRSCTRGLIGYTDPDVLSTLSENHDTKKESFEKYWSEVGDTVKTKAEAKIYDDVNSKLEDYWKIEKEIKKLGLNIADPGAPQRRRAPPVQWPPSARSPVGSVVSRSCQKLLSLKNLRRLYGLIRAPRQ